MILWYFHIMECFAIVKMNKLQPQVSIWMNLKNPILSEINQFQKDRRIDVDRMILFI